MTATKAIIRTEWRILIRERWPILAGLLYLALLLCGIANGIAWRSQWMSVNAQTQRSSDEAWAALRHDLPLYQQGKLNHASFNEGKNIREKLLFPDDPYIVGFYGKIAATLPPRALTELNIGQSDLHPSAYLISTRQFKDVVAGNQTGEALNPYHLLLGGFDAAFVVIFLLPIFVIALTYDVTSTDRENGTLPLLLANPLPKWKLALIKICTRVSPPVVLTLLAGVAAHMSTGQFAVPQLTIWCLLVAAYSMFWAALAFVLDFRNLAPATNALVLCMAWILFVPVLPAVIQLVAAAAEPVPSRSTLMEQFRWTEVEADKPESKERMLRKLLETRFPGLIAPASDYYDRLPHAGKGQLNRQEIVELFSSRYFQDQKNRAAAEKIEQAADRQEEIAKRLSLLSPALMMRYTLDELTGTSSTRFRRFTLDVAAYHTDLRICYVEHMLSNQPMTLDDFDRLPKLEVSY